MLFLLHFLFCREIYGKNLNKDFINTGRLGHCFIKLFIIFPLLKGGSPYDEDNE